MYNFFCDFVVGCIIACCFCCISLQAWSWKNFVAIFFAVWLSVVCLLFTAALSSRPLDWKEYVLRENATVAPVTCFKHVSWLGYIEQKIDITINCLFNSEVKHKCTCC